MTAVDVAGLAQSSVGLAIDGKTEKTSIGSETEDFASSATHRQTLRVDVAGLAQSSVGLAFGDEIEKTPTRIATEDFASSATDRPTLCVDVAGLAQSSVGLAIDGQTEKTSIESATEDFASSATHRPTLRVDVAGLAQSSAGLAIDGQTEKTSIESATEDFASSATHRPTLCVDVPDLAERSGAGTVDVAFEKVMIGGETEDFVSSATKGELSTRSHLRESVTFLKEFVKHPTKVGAIAPSSPALVRRMLEWFDWNSIRSVVEFGPGTGVFTEAIVRSLHPEAKFFAIERSAQMTRIARERCPEAIIIEDSATNLHAICDDQGVDKIDAVICGLPWASFPESLQIEIIETMIERMAPEGRFATFAYWQGVILPAGRSFSKRLKSNFRTVERSPTAWRNLPPAFVYRCKT